MPCRKAPCVSVFGPRHSPPSFESAEMFDWSSPLNSVFVDTGIFGEKVSQNTTHVWYVVAGKVKTLVYTSSKVRALSLSLSLSAHTTSDKLHGLSQTSVSICLVQKKKKPLELSNQKFMQSSPWSSQKYCHWRRQSVLCSVCVSEIFSCPLDSQWKNFIVLYISFFFLPLHQIDVKGV